jgi:hypothetical protein
VHCLVTAGKHVKSVRAIVRQPPITKLKRLLEPVLFIRFTRKVYSEDPRPAKCILFESQPVKRRLESWRKIDARLEPSYLRVDSW